jgi:hypothetical protein
MPCVLVVHVLCGIGLALLISRQLNHSFTIPQTAEWNCHERRRLPLWLLSDDRLLYLRGLGGLIREMKIRHRRSRIFRQHLNDVKSEFRSTCTALMVVMAQSPCDRPDLASRLVNSQVVFNLVLLKVRFRLLRYRVGLR